MLNQDRESFIGHAGKLLCLFLKFCVYENDMPCALEINSVDDGSKRGYVESYPSTTTNTISLLPQCLWPPNLAGW